MTGRQTSKYIYYRCLGNDASRWGGKQLCTNRMVRTDCLDAAVWNDVVALLQNPRLLAGEQARRRQQPGAAPQRAQLARQIQHAQRAVTRLIDAYQDGLLEKHEWEPRLTQARDRLQRLQSQEQHLTDREAEEAALDHTLVNLEHFADEIRRGLEQADWDTRRQILRTLIQSIHIEPDQVRITYRLRLPPFASRQRILHFCCSRVSPLVSTCARSARKIPRSRRAQVNTKRENLPTKRKWLAGLDLDVLNPSCHAKTLSTWRAPSRAGVGAGAKRCCLPRRRFGLVFGPAHSLALRVGLLVGALRRVDPAAKR
jgi:site-specific DNA recombinase